MIETIPFMLSIVEAFIWVFQQHQEWRSFEFRVV